MCNVAKEMSVSGVLIRIERTTRSAADFGLKEIKLGKRGTAVARRPPQYVRYLLTAATRAKKIRQVITSTKVAKGEALIFWSFPARAP